MNPRIRVYGTASSAQIGKWIGFAKKKLRDFKRLSATFEKRLWLSDAQITITGRGTAMDWIRIKPLGVEGAGIFQRLLTISRRQIGGESESSIILTQSAGAINRILTGFSLDENGSETIPAVGTTALSTAANPRFQDGVVNVNPDYYDRTNASRILSKGFGTGSLDALSVIPEQGLPGAQLFGGFVIPVQNLPSTWQTATGGDAAYFGAFDLSYVNSTHEHVVYRIGKNNTGVVGNWTLDGAADFFTVAIPRSQTPDNWPLYETAEFDQVTPGQALAIPFGGVTLVTVPTLVINPISAYFDANGRRPWTSNGPDHSTANRVSVDTVDIVNGVVNANNTISGTLRFTFGSGAFDFFRCRAPTGYVLQDLRQFIDVPSTRIFVGDRIPDDDDSDIKRSTIVSVDPFYGFYTTYSKIRETITNNGVVDSVTTGTMTVDLLETVTTTQQLVTFNRRFTFNSSINGWQVSALPTNQMAVTSRVFGIAYDGENQEVQTSYDETSAGTLPIQRPFDGAVYTLGNATLSYDTSPVAGGWTLTQAGPGRDNPGAFFPTTVGVFSTGPSSIYLDGVVIYNGSIAFRERDIAQPANQVSAPSAYAGLSIAGTASLPAWALGITGQEDAFVDFGFNTASVLPNQTASSYFLQPGERPLLSEAATPIPGYSNNTLWKSNSFGPTILETIPRPTSGCSIFAPKVDGVNDGICIASKTGSFNAAFDAYHASPSAANQTAMQAEYTIVWNNFAPRSVIELALRDDQLFNGYYFIV